MKEECAESYKGKYSSKQVASKNFKCDKTITLGKQAPE